MLDRDDPEDAPREPGDSDPDQGEAKPALEVLFLHLGAKPGARDGEPQPERREERHEPRDEERVPDAVPHEREGEDGENDAMARRPWIGAEADREDFAQHALRLRGHASLWRPPRTINTRKLASIP